MSSEIIDVVIKEPTELQKKVCNQAIEKGLVQPYDIIDYTYSNARLDEINSGKIKTKNSANNQIANALTTKGEHNGVCVPVRIGNIYGEQFGTGYAGNVWDKNAISPALMTMQGGNRQPLIVDEPKWMCTDINADIAQTLTAKGQQNWTGSFISPDIEKLEKSTTIGSTEPVKIHLKNGETITSNDDTSTLRIRKLTPKECWRLMGFYDEDFEKAEKVCSNSQLYKQAGNSIVVNVLEAIFKELFVPKQTRSEWLDELLGDV